MMLTLALSQVPVLGAGREPAPKHDDLHVAGCVRPDQEQRAQAGDCKRRDHQSGEGHQHPQHDDRDEAEVSSH